MLAVIWMTLFFYMMCSVQTDRSHTTGAVPKSHKRYRNGWSITFSEGQTSEAGLCIIIQCSFTHEAAFKPTSAVWFKDDDRDIIFHSEDVMKAQVPFRGRVALLEPNISQKNCGITINDLTLSDSGSYEFRVEGQLNGQSSAFTFDLKRYLRVTGLIQKPKVKLPPALTEGQQTTLTCTAPGLCSGTPPYINWTWRKTGHFALDVSLIPSNSTIFKTENLTGISQRHSSTLTFTPSSEHDGSEVVCQVTFKGNIKAVETVTLNVTSPPGKTSDVLYAPVSVLVEVFPSDSVAEGGRVNMICSADANPAVISYTWYQRTPGPAAGSSGSLVQVGSGGQVLVLTYLQLHQTGRYFCQTRNSVGETNSTEVLLQMIMDSTHSDVVVLRLVMGVKLLAVLLFPLLMLWLWKQGSVVDKAEDDYVNITGSDAGRRRGLLSSADQDTRVVEEESNM